MSDPDMFLVHQRITQLEARVLRQHSQLQWMVWGLLIGVVLGLIT